MVRTGKLLRIIFSLLCLASGMMMAQGTAGSISGTVKDSSGALLPQVTIVVLNSQTGISRTVVTDQEGRYSAQALSLGLYSVTGTFTGFQTVVRSGIELTVGRDATVDLTLTVGSVSDKVEVTGEAPLLETSSATVGFLVDQRTIRELPLNGRSYDQLALLQPGVVALDAGRPNNFEYGMGKRFSVGGQNPGANLFLLDGTIINDQGNGTPGGAAGTNLGVDAILEFKTLTNAFDAEYGHSSGGVITSVTRSGTNQLHGTIFHYIRNSAVDARNYFDVEDEPPPFKRNQFGGVLGGPIIRDKTFFFGAYEGMRQRLGTSQIAFVPTLAARQGILPDGTVVPVNPASVPFLNLYPAPNGHDFGNGVAEYISAPSSSTNQDYFMGRVDHQLTARTGIFGRYTFDNDNTTAPFSIPGGSRVGAGRRQYVTIQANTVISPKTLNNFRFAFNRTAVDVDRVYTNNSPAVILVPGQDQQGSIAIGNISGFAGTREITQLGGDSGGDGREFWKFNVFQFADDFSFATGKHFWKVGVDIQRVQDNTSTASSTRGQYTFRTFEDFLAGTPENLEVAGPVGSPFYTGLRQTVFAMYLKDDFTVSPRLTLNFGLRWEFTTDPKEVNGKMSRLPSATASAFVVSDRYFEIAKKNIEPRVGLAWQLTGSGKTVLRAGAGIYHNQILPWHYAQHISNPPLSGKFSLDSCSDPGCTPLAFPNGAQALIGVNPNAAPGTVTPRTVVPFVKVPTNYQYNLSLQHEVYKNTVVELAYTGSKGTYLPTSHEGSGAIPVFCPNPACPSSLPAGTKYFPEDAPVRNPAWDGIRYLDNIGTSNYNAGFVRVSTQNARGFQGQVSYTFSKALDAAGIVAGSLSRRSPDSLMDPQDRLRDYGLSDWDQRHKLTGNFSMPIPGRVQQRVLNALLTGWTFDGIITVGSGSPFTALLEAPVSRDRAANPAERPDLVPGFSNNPTSGVTAGCDGIPAGEPLKSPSRWYDPCAFTLPLEGTYGNVGKNTIIGPSLKNVDVALKKRFRVQEKADLTFRFEVFNLFNRANFGLPNGPPLQEDGSPNPSAGRLTYTQTTARQFQLALRIGF